MSKPSHTFQEGALWSTLPKLVSYSLLAVGPTLVLAELAQSIHASRTGHKGASVPSVFKIALALSPEN